MFFSGGGCLFVFNFLEMFDSDTSGNSIPPQKGTLNLRNICVGILWPFNG